MNELNELTLKLKNEVIRQLTKNEQNMDVAYIITGDKSYTKRELAAEIENETQFGIKMLSDMIMLSIDLTARHK